MLPDVTVGLRLEKILWIESHGSLFVVHFPVAGKTAQRTFRFHKMREISWQT